MPNITMVSSMMTSLSGSSGTKRACLPSSMNRRKPAVAVGLILGGIVGVLAAFPLVKLLSSHLTPMRWVVTAVIAYAAIAMLRSARASQLDPAVPAASA